MAVSVSALDLVVTTKQPFASPEEVLAHFGVKGMHWGIRKKEDTAGDSSSASEYKAVKPKKPTPKEAAKSIRKSEETFLEKVNPSENGQPAKKGLSPAQKKALYIGIGALAAAAIFGGAAYAHHKGYLGGSKGSSKPVENLLSKRYLEELMLAKKNAWGSGSSLGYIQPSSHERESFSIPAGHTFHRLSSKAESSFGSATYSTHKMDDYHRYLGHGFVGLIENGAELHHVTFTSKQEVKVPNLKTTLDTLKDIMSSRGMSTSPEDVMYQYTGLCGSNWSNDISTKLFKSLSAKGYGALVDEMDSGVISDSPLVVFAHELFNSKIHSPVTMNDVETARKSMIPLKTPKL